MSALSKLNTLLESISLPVETGYFSETNPKARPPDEYAVLTPLVDTLDMFADNEPQVEVQEVRISLFSKKNYNERKNQITKLLLQEDFTITDRRYIEFEKDTLIHHYVIDIAKHFERGE